MNLYALLSLCASAISITLGISVYLLNRKALINKLFMGMMLFNAYWAFVTFMMSQSPTLVGAIFWNKVLFLWPILVALMLHFTLAFTENELLKNKLVYVALYFPALLFSLIDLTTNWISTAPALTLWGYMPSIPIDSVVSRLDGIWAAVISLLVLFFLASYHSKVIDRKRKQQTKFMAAGLAVPIVISLLTDSIFPVLGIEFPVLGSISGTITSVLIVLAILKYDLFSLRPEVAAENVFSTMPDSVILVSLKGNITKVNRAFLELTRYSENELLGTSITEMLKKTGVENKESASQIMAQLIHARELKNYEVTFKTKSGKPKTGMLSCSIVVDSSGHDVGAALVLHDMTEHKELEQKLLRAERFASIGELATMLGHDLRNPLSGISGAAYYLKKKHAGSLDDDDLAMFASIDKSINYSNKIVNDLLDFSSCYSGEVKLSLTPITPKVLMNEALALAMPPKNVTIIDQTQSSPKFKADEVQICRSFINILKNAFDAMPDGGELRLKSEVVNEKVVFTFADNGFGMTEETLGKLWTPLFTTKAKGMGFGLAICKRNVEAHGGRIFVESAPERGTTVRVELPLRLSDS
jgi:PAS domain S-box-containing protein